MTASSTPPDATKLLQDARWLQSLAKCLVADASRADDVVQEAWVRALRRPPAHDRSLRGWWATVMRNCAREIARSEKAREARERRVAVSEIDMDQPAEVLARAEAHEHLVKAVLALDEPYRQVLLWRYFDAREPSEIARLLGVPPGTVRSQVKRGIEQLRARLDREDLGGRRAWALALLPLATYESTGVASAMTTGAIIMSWTAKTKILLAAVVLAALVASGILLLGPDFLGPEKAGDGASDERAAISAAPSAEDEPRLEGRPAEEDGAHPVVLAAAVDLDQCDRSLDLHGVVVHENGTPVPGATLQVFDYPWRRGGVFVSLQRLDTEQDGPSTRSAGDGSFSLRLAAGCAGHLRVEAEGLASGIVRNVQAGQRLRVVLKNGVRLTVLVRMADGTPAADVSVRLGEVGRRGDFGFRRVGTTDARGRCAFEGLPAGAAATMSLAHPTAGSAGWLIVRLKDDGETLYEYTLPAGRTLRGRVTDAGSGTPVVGARVGMSFRVDPYVETDSNGLFELRGWTGGTAHQVTAVADGYSHTSRTVGESDTIDFALHRGVRIIGRVLGQRGPVESARVAAVASDSGPSHRVSFATAESRTDGGFTLEGLAHDMPHTIVLMAEGYGRTLFDVDAHPDTGTVLDVGDLHLHPARVLAGVVVDEDGVPQARVQIDLAGANEDRARLREPDAGPAQTRYGSSDSLWTDDLGRFRFNDLSPGTYHLTATPEGARTVYRQVRLSEAEDVMDVMDVIIELAATRSLRVRVLNPDGTPRAGAFVMALGRNAGGGKAITDAHGEVSLNIRPDVETVRVDLARVGDLLVPQPKHVEEGVEVIEFHLRPGRQISGRIVGPDGKAIANAQIEVHSDGRPIRRVSADVNGRFRAKLPASDTVALVFRGRVGANTFLAFEGRIDHVSADDGELLLRASAVSTDRRMSILVLRPDGLPLKGAHVQLSPSGIGGQRTDARGRIELKDLPARATTVRVIVQQPESGDWILPLPQTVTPDAQELMFHVRTGVRIDGMVETPDGKPAGQATVRVYRHGKIVSGFNSRSDGSFSLPVDPHAEMRLQIDAVLILQGRLYSTDRIRVDPRAASLTLRLRELR